MSTPLTLWWQCTSGIAGDMALGSLLDAGAEVDVVRAGLEGLGVAGWELRAEPVVRGGLTATRAVVEVDETAAGSRTWADIAALLDGADLPPRAGRRARAVFAALAGAEGAIHGQDPADVHFHEVGGLDAIVDVVGACLALEDLGVDHVHASAVAVGGGEAVTRHGTLPVPVPAVLELLRDAPLHGTDQPFELTTPTGAALLAGLGATFGPLPPLVLAATGRGAGGRELDGRPNVLTAVLGTPPAAEAGGGPAGPDRIDAADVSGGQPLVLLETNLDDVTGELLGHLVGALLDAGAHDAWIVAATGKKGRPTHVVSALADPARAGALRALIVAETGTLGVRATHLGRWTAARETVTVEVDGHPVAVKVSAARAKAEHDDVRRAAAALGLPLRVVAARAEAGVAVRDVGAPGGGGGV